MSRCSGGWAPGRAQGDRPGTGTAELVAAMAPDGPALLKDRLCLYQLHESFPLPRGSFT